MITSKQTVSTGSGCLIILGFTALIVVGIAAGYTKHAEVTPGENGTTLATVWFAKGAYNSETFDLTENKCITTSGPFLSAVPDDAHYAIRYQDGHKTGEGCWNRTSTGLRMYAPGRPDDEYEIQGTLPDATPLKSEAYLDAERKRADQDAHIAAIAAEVRQEQAQDAAQAEINVDAARKYGVAEALIGPHGRVYGLTLDTCADLGAQLLANATTPEKAQSARTFSKLDAMALHVFEGGRYVYSECYRVASGGIYIYDSGGGTQYVTGERVPFAGQ